MADILKELADYLSEGKADWDGKEMLVLSAALKEASNLAVMDSENQLRREHHPFLAYCESKKQQYELLERMPAAAARMDAGLEQGRRIGRFMRELAQRVRLSGEIYTCSEKLRRIREYHKTLPMPADRAEFENRAALFTLVNELELFLQKDQRFPGFS